MTALVNVPETAAPGEIVEVKVLISHPMETGFRPNRDGQLIPRNVIPELRCLYRGTEVFRAEIFPAIAANPFFSFNLRVEETGDVELIWSENGEEQREARTISVA